MRRRRVVVFGAIFGAGLALAWTIACTFPTTQFAPESPAKDGATRPGEGGSGVEGSTTLPDGANPDGNPCVGANTECDCDDDHDLSTACDGGDCDDKNPNVRSTQTDFIDLPSSNGGDWNCDKNVERQGDAGVVCADLLDGAPRPEAQVLAACTREGFVGDPACGESAAYNTCERMSVNDVKCRIKPGTATTKTRACR